MVRLLAVLVVICGLGACSQTAPDVVPSMPATASDFDAGLNAFRRDAGLQQLQPNQALANAAQAHAADMNRGTYFSHVSRNGATFADRARAAGCDLRAGAENIAQGQRTEAQVLSSWLNSPGHRANMAQPDYALYGLGRSGDYWVLKLSAAC